MSTAPAGGDGSLARPFNTLQAAVDEAKSRWDAANFRAATVVSCGGTFIETVTAVDFPLVLWSQAPTIWKPDPGLDTVFLNYGRTIADSPAALWIGSAIESYPQVGWFLLANGAPSKTLMLFADVAGSTTTVPLYLADMIGLAKTNLEFSAALGPGMDLSLDNVLMEDIAPSFSAGSSPVNLAVARRSQAADCYFDEIGHVSDSAFAKLNATGTITTFGSVVGGMAIGLYNTVITSDLGCYGVAATLPIDGNTQAHIFRETPIIDVALTLDSQEGYAAASPADWGGSAPATVKDALDRIAAALGPIP